ncbi:CopD family protein [uncultured Paraglaciecola sp.]|jgi:putative membrane protein|uniref:CopD family protein n=1 Tax=uncultured Paraglaciecola sp. TaxID=1765024 RepID=UPI0026096599|nr:CopD family protein [uncultured Paraglaciecola sp.]
MTLLWIKALHVFFMVAWMSGLFYLPRLMVYHAQSDVQAVKEQFKIMEKRLWFFVTPFAVLTLVFGVWLINLYGKDWFVAAKWLHIKLSLVTVLYVYHGYLFVLVQKFSKDENTHSSRFYRFLNEAPVLLVLAIIVLATVKYF